MDYKGGNCIFCGYNKSLSALEFHHMNPQKKDGIKAHWSFEKSKTELDKCILLCANCHREFHEELIKIEDTLCV